MSGGSSALTLTVTLTITQTQTQTQTQTPTQTLGAGLDVGRIDVRSVYQVFGGVIPLASTLGVTCVDLYVGIRLRVLGY